METLAERIARDGPVSELDAIGWAIRLGKRLESLHALGVAHGSVSPACVLTAGRDRNARAYLADLQHTASSLAYQSPERILGGALSAADDVWALAATLYALLTGQPPFGGANEAEARQKILAASPAPLAVFDVGDDDLQHILDKAFARELPQRTASAVAFRRALEEWHPDRGVANLPPLEDEDANGEEDGDDGARTMMVRDGSALMPTADAGRGGPAHQPGPAGNAAGLLPVEDDDDDDARTVMRVVPQDAVKAILARGGQPLPAALPAAGQPANAAAAVPGRASRTLGLDPEARPSPAFGGHPAQPPRAPGQHGGAGAVPRFGPPPAAAAPLPRVADEESFDDVRTVMREPEPIGAPGSEEAQAPRPWGGAGPTLAMPLRDSDPAPTMALPISAAAFGIPIAMGETPMPPARPAPGASPAYPAAQPPPNAMPAPMMPRPASPGTIPMAAFNPLAPQGAPQAPPPNPTFGGGGFPAPQAPAPNAYAAQPAPPAPAPVQAPLDPAPAAGPAKSKLAILAVVALLVAAGITFAVLKLKGL